MNSVIVVGLGSMGCRRIRLLLEMTPDLRIGGVDTQEERRQKAAETYGIQIFTSVETAVNEIQPEAGFVCTSPLSHWAVILELLKNRLHVFTELNLVSDGYQEIVSMAKNMGVKLFLSSTFLYRKDIQFIIEKVQGIPVNYSIHTGQYLPDWHPWESYQNYFVGNKRTNGCREIFAIDLPWMLKAFGTVKHMQIYVDRLSQLRIDYPDNYIVVFTHQNGSKGVFFNDVISRHGGRRAEIFNARLHLEWGGTPDSLYQYDLERNVMCQVETYAKGTEHLEDYKNTSIIEDAYKDEIQAFFREINGEGGARYTFADDLQTLALIDRIEGKNKTN